ncbi:hypothetical protein DYU05_20455 [Mucilaginibacter terrenus]|uniref:GH26 domain-containing protein n=1 Tax=Mucilaginibacter terrenus TaxID=2482727 RepID=A0A3E2NJE9_9SPHI|nr:hypothetical protein [Mucilaginibacter terrenus]RFZ81134.1 hypothetical protein DYU05_20455 [Mucilaginibacter terrenus]
MKNKATTFYIILGTIAVILIAAFVFARPLIGSYLVNDCYKTTQPVVALFDRNKPEENRTLGNIEHYDVVFKNTAFWFDDKLLKAALTNHDVLITIETWLKGPSGDRSVLDAVNEGDFDGKFTKLARLVAKSGHQVYIRWAPDMEVNAYMYPWQLHSSTDYIAAFNHVAKLMKQDAPKVKIVWGPSGYPGDTEYWPGLANVDYASITLGSPSEYSTTSYPFAKTIPDMLKAKLHRLRFLNVPVLIIGADDGAKGYFKQEWLTNQLAYMNKYANTVYSSANYITKDPPKPKRTTLQIGAFDPNRKLIHQKEITIEHIFVDLGDVQRGTFEKTFMEIVNRHRDVIVTMEPWRDTTGVADSVVTRSILSGKYDKVIRKLFRVLALTNQKVLLRWMHEMEIPIHRYAWQSQDPAEYIQAYRYFMLFEGGPPKNVKKVWGPAGDRGSIDFWPGDDVVDFISVAIYGLPDKNITDPNKQESFSSAFNRKFYRMRFSDKPIFITEFGVKGPEAYQDKWLAGAAKTINDNPHVFGACYFNLYDNPKAWGKIKAPDWSISARSMAKFTAQLKNVEVR